MPKSGWRLETQGEAEEFLKEQELVFGKASSSGYFTVEEKRDLADPALPFLCSHCSTSSGQGLPCGVGLTLLRFWVLFWG